MQSKFITVDGVSLAYMEKNTGSDKTIFFIHGNSCSCRMWLKQFNDPCFETYRLIAIDLPAHGLSSQLPAGAEDYHCISFGKIVVKMMQLLSVKNNFILVGYSLGANVVAEMLAFGCKPDGIVLGGSSVIGGEYTPDVVLYEGGAANILFLNECPAETVTAFFGTLSLSIDEEDRNILLEDYYKVKDSFRGHFYQNTISGKISNGIEILRQKNIPMLVIFGEEEKIINRDYLDNALLNFWNDTIYKIPRAGHPVNIDQPKDFNNLLASYCSEMFK